MADATVEVPLDDGAPLEESATMPEDWSTVEVTIPKISESIAFGTAKMKVYFDVFLDGKFFRSFRYSQLNGLKSILAKQFKDESKTLSRFPSKTLLSFGSKNKEQVEDRRKQLELWLQSVCKKPAITKSSQFVTFMQTAPDFDEIDQELTEKVQGIIDIPPSDWKQTAQKKGVTLWTLSMEGSKFLVVKSFVKIGVPKSFVLGIYNNKEAWRHWQPDMKVCKTIQSLDGSLAGEFYKEVIYVSYHIPVISNRDVSLYYHQREGSFSNKGNKDCTTLMSCSILHPDIPRVKGHVRGDLNVSLTTFTSVDGGKATTVESVLHMDPKGMIPSSVVNTMSAHAVDTIVDMRTYMDAEYEKKGGHAVHFPEEKQEATGASASGGDQPAASEKKLTTL